MTKKKTSKKVTKKRPKHSHSLTSAERAAKKKAARKKADASKRKKYPKRKTDFSVRVTPTKAKALLATNFEGQRNLRPTKVTQYVGILRRGLWMESGEPIKIDWHGILIDGQHRLAAIIKSGIPAKLDLTYGLPPKAFDVIDTGAVRQLYDVLPVQYPKQISSIYRIYLDFMQTRGEGYTSFGSRSSAAYREDRVGAIQWAQRHERTLTRIVETCFVDRDARGLLRPPAIFMAFFFVAHQKAPKLANDFFQSFIDGTAFEFGKADPIYQLREQIITFNADYRVKRGKSTPLWVVGGLLIKAWNLWMLHERVTTPLVMGESESWPLITDRTTRGRKAKAA